MTVETYVGSPLRNAPWPHFDNGMLNSTFGGVGGERLADSSYLGNIAYTGDYFLRVPQQSRRWIAHVDDDGEYEDPETREWVKPDIAKYKMGAPLDIMRRLELGHRPGPRRVDRRRRAHS